MKKSNNSKIKFIILNFGYVESSYPFSWIFEHRQGFNTKFEAAQSLALEYFSIYNEKYPETQLDECCIKANENKDKFCKQCGTNILSLIENLSEGFAEEYKNWLNSNCTSNHDECDISDHFSSYSNWNCMNPPYGITIDNSLYIGQAEKILTGLLYEHVNEDKKQDIDEEIFNRTNFDKFKLSFDKNDGPSIYEI